MSGIPPAGEQLGLALRLLHLRVRDVINRHLASCQLDERRCLILVALSNGPANQSAVAGLVRIDRADMANIAADLEREKLIKRSVNPDNRRERILTLTPAGDEKRRKAGELLLAAHSEIRAGLPDVEWRAGLAFIDKLLKGVAPLMCFAFVI